MSELKPRLRFSKARCDLSVIQSVLEKKLVLESLILKHSGQENHKNQWNVKILLLTVFLLLPGSTAALGPREALLFIEPRGNSNLHLLGGTQVITGAFGSAFEFKNSLQQATLSISNQFDGLKSLTVGGWFFLRQSGEQHLVSRGAVEFGNNGERFFRREEKWVNFLLGTDQRGFLMGAINGNGYMPFPQVSISEVRFDEWSQLAVVIAESGIHPLYQNGVLVHSDNNAGSSKNWPFVETSPGQNIKLSIPLGG